MLTPFIRFTLSHVFPHGITDAIHAKHTSQEKALCLTYLGGLVSVGGVYPHFASLSPFCQHIGTFVFFLASATHFRYDMPMLYWKNRLIPRWIWSSCFLGVCVYNHWLLFVFISLIHTPHHYIRSWHFIQPYKKETLLYLTVLFIGCYQAFPLLQMNSLGYSLIISHILYEELYIHKRLSFL
jgi:hypothetical protein